jgi:AraC family transcriptional regulator
VSVSGARLEPWTNLMRLDHSSTMRAHRYADRFSIARVETTGPLANAVHKSSSVPALLVSVFVRPVATPSYQLWVNGAVVPTGSIPAFHANVVDLDAEPAMWAAGGIDYVHFHVRRAAIDDAAADLGYERIGGIRLSIAEEDMVLAQFTKSILPILGGDARTSPLALDHLELLVGAHVMQRYGASRPSRTVVPGGLAPWQRRRATELLRENLDGTIRLADVAQACELSVSHFARSFKASFRVTCHRWLTERRIERTQELLAATDTPLVDVATQAGFADQAAFTRTFSRLVGLSPGRWRREHKRAPR